MNEYDDEGCGCIVAFLIIGAIAACMIWEYNHPSPKGIVNRQQHEQRAQEDRELAEWDRIKKIREMHADKSKAEEPK